MIGVRPNKARIAAAMDGNSVASVGTYAAPEGVDLGEATRVIGMAVRLPILSPPGDPGASGRHGALAGWLLGRYQWPPVLLLLVIALAVARTGLL